MSELIVEVVRGDTVESRHRVHAVAVCDGRIVASAGDPQYLTFMRSSSKPLQALPLARARPDLADDELAIACASHLARPEQLDPVRRLLAAAGATEDDLECGAVGAPPSRLNLNCSGKHAGMLNVCRAHDWTLAGYRLASHPLQRQLHAETAAAAGLEPEQVAVGVDGCGVLSFAMPLERMAVAFARLPSLDGGAAIVRAMRAHPALIRAPGAPDTVLMEQADGWIAKGGAEALMCAAGPDGTAFALKVEDGSGRAVRPATAAFAAQLGIDLPQLAVESVDNSLGERVGQIRAAA